MIHKRLVIASALLLLGVAGVVYGYILVSYAELGGDGAVRFGTEARIKELEKRGGFAYLFVRDKERITYNLGIQYFTKNDFPEAISSFQAVIESSRDPELRAKAEYNIGVIFLKTFIATGDANSLKFAIERFQNALRDNPNEEDARYNLEKIYSNSSSLPAVKPTDPNGDPGEDYGEGTPDEDF